MIAEQYNVHYSAIALSLLKGKSKDLLTTTGRSVGSKGMGGEVCDIADVAISLFNFFPHCCSKGYHQEKQRSGSKRVPAKVI